MRRYILAFISIIVFSSTLFSQSTIDNVLKEIEMNNTTLSALRKVAEADKIGNKTGIYLENPQIGYNYLWSTPSTLGKRTDLTITQSFDFPTAYRYKNNISDIKNIQVELEYQKQLKTLLLQARMVCLDLIYTNSLKSELSKRLTHAQSIANSYKSKYDFGEANILEYNKSRLNLLNISKKLESVNIEREALLADLAGLNGGQVIDFNDSEFQTPILAIDFELWYLQAEQNNPLLSWLKQEIEISRNREKLNRALSLPKLKAGYISEKIVGEHFQGITAGLTIPLWENKNKVKHAKVQAEALQNITFDNKLQFYNRLKSLHTKAIGLQKNVNDYRLNLRSFDSSELLKKALDNGEITLIDYILELSIYYDSVNALLELDRELNRTFAELFQFI